MEYDLEKIKERRLSYSSLSQFKKSPQHFIQYINERKPMSEAFVFGNLVDTMILTPDTWEHKFVILPPKPSFLKDLVEQHGKELGRELYEKGKEDYAKFMKDNEGKIFIDQSDLDEAMIIVEKVYENTAASELLSRITRTQRELKWTDKKTGLKMVSYLDGTGENIVIELKTTANANPENFAMDCRKWGYYLQAGIYCEGLKAIEFSFPEFYYLAVEKSAPYGVSVLKADDKYIEYGKNEYRLLMDKFKYCLDNDLFNSSYEFKSPIGSSHTLSLPNWMTKDMEDE